MRRAVLLLALYLASCTPPPADPWPECAEVRKILARNANDPSRLEIAEWVQRIASEDPGPPPEPSRDPLAGPSNENAKRVWDLRKQDWDYRSVYIEVRWREPNRFGATEARAERIRVITRMPK